MNKEIPSVEEARANLAKMFNALRLELPQEIIGDLIERVHAAIDAESAEAITQHTADLQRQLNHLKSRDKDADYIIEDLQTQLTEAQSQYAEMCSIMDCLQNQVAERDSQIVALMAFEKWLDAQIKFETPSSLARLTDFGRGSLDSLHKTKQALTATAEAGARIERERRDAVLEECVEALKQRFTKRGTASSDALCDALDAIQALKGGE